WHGGVIEQKRRTADELLMAGWDRGSLATTDRILLGACAAIFLLLLGVSVAALVVLVDLGQGFQQTAGGSHTGALYSIIGAAAVIIVSAIPILLRARTLAPSKRSASGPVQRPGGPPRRAVQATPYRGTDDRGAER